MCKSLIMIVVLYLLILPTMQAQAKSDNNAAVNNKAGAPTIAVTKLVISDKTLKLLYEIRNESEQDVWILVGFGKSGASAELFMDKDDQTILIRRRFDVPFGGGGDIAPGRYVLMRTGEAQTESVSLAIPVYPQYEFADRRNARGLEYATRLVVEIGYYPGDMPGMIRGLLEKEEKSRDKKSVVYPTYPTVPTTIKEWFTSLLLFKWYNWPDKLVRQGGKLVRHRGEELLIPWTGQFRMGEQVLRITIDGLRIPYDEKYDRPKVSPPDLNLCTRLEILYQPSVLDYFFPYPNERDLLSAEEVKCLQSLQKIVADNQEHIKAFAHEVGEGLLGGIFTERSTARVICYRDGERLTSFTIYDDSYIVTEEEHCIRYNRGLPSLKILTPQIQPFQLRLECADNLRNLWSLLRFLYKRRFWFISYNTYSASKWCTAIVRDDRASDIPTEYTMRYFKCPAAGEGKSHYAMNPKCKPDSLPETVLLFETKAGWNQHGGPELFTFDNHDPKGGCVLLNDGTVKFIRTREELQQLRWK